MNIGSIKVWKGQRSNWLVYAPLVGYTVNFDSVKDAQDYVRQCMDQVLNVKEGGKK